jgi:predicted dehydrogenase
VAYYRRFYPIVEALHDLVTSGRVGTVTSAQVVCRSYSIPPRWAGVTRALPRWRTSLAQAGGGGLTDVGSHRLDLLFWLLGDARSVSAIVERIVTWTDGEDQANVTVQFANRAIGHLDQSWCSQAPSDSLIVHGTESTVTIPDLEGTLLRVQNSRKVRTHKLEPRSAVTHYPLVADFVAALNGEGSIRCSGADALRTTQVIELAYRAARERRTLDVPSLGSL